MIYVPDYDTWNCAYLYNTNVLRVYENIPQNGRTINYREYAIDNHYIYRDGVTTFNNYTTLPTCISDNDITDSIYYRTDFSDIVIVAFIFCFVAYFFVNSLFNTLFKNTKRWL